MSDTHPTRLPDAAPQLEARHVQTRYGPTGYLDSGGDLPVALFVHGVATSSLLWRNAMAELAGERRCIAVDLPLHGRTPAPAELGFSFEAMAGFLTDFCEALELDAIDLVANDTGGAIAQVFAVRQAARLRTFTLTNCDTQGNLPPKAFLPTVLLARLGLLAPLGHRSAGHPKRVRRVFRSTYENVGNLPLDVVRQWSEPIFGSAATARQFQGWIAGMNDRELAAIEPELQQLDVPTLLVWGTGDRFFGLRWAEWLQRTIPGAQEIVDIPGGKLFFPDERAAEFAAAVRPHWQAHAPTSTRH